jgi:hypothetical protein
VLPAIPTSWVDYDPQAIAAKNWQIERIYYHLSLLAQRLCEPPRSVSIPIKKVLEERAVQIESMTN